MNLLITTQFGEMAGSTYSIYFLARGLTEKGHRVVLSAPNGCLLQSLAAQSNLIFEPIPFRYKWQFKSIKALNRVVKTYNTDLINAQESKDRHNVMLWKWIFGHKTKIVFTRRQRIADNNPIKRWLHTRYADRLVSVSHGLKQIMVQKGYTEPTISVIHNGVDLSDFHIAKEKLKKLKENYGTTKDQHVIGCVARPKEQVQIVKALEYLPESYVILFVGIDKDKVLKKLSKTSRNRFADRLIFTGEVLDRSALIHHYGLMHVHVLPTQMDGFGLVLLEAMAMGVPVIGTNYGGVRDVITDGKNGFLFENNQIDHLANVIQQCVEDMEIRSRLILNGHKTVYHQFPLENTILQHEQLFESLLA